jgi:hypothetical protein
MSPSDANFVAKQRMKVGLIWVLLTWGRKQAIANEIFDKVEEGQWFSQ